MPTYPPNPNPTAIPILTKPPTRPHVRLGDIQAEPSSDSVSAAEIRQSLQNTAAKLGTDAVVIAHDRNQDLGAWLRQPEPAQAVLLGSTELEFATTTPAALVCQRPTPTPPEITLTPEAN